jgi:predicted nucleic acid-binding protein
VITAIDANVVIDVLSGDERFAPGSIRALRRCAAEGRLVIGGAALVEVLTGFADVEVGRTRFAALGVSHLPMSADGAIEAARARQRARRDGAVRERLLPDFLIGGHALAQAERLLTRDTAFYRRWFPELAVADPADL